MAVRNCAEIGENLQMIITRLMANDNLVKLLYYQESNPLQKPNLTTTQKQELIFNKLIKFVPRIDPLENSQSTIAVTVIEGNKLSSNDQFRDVNIVVSVYVPLTQWIIQDNNLRPFAILGEVQKSLSGKKINGLGTLDGGDFALTKLTDEISMYDSFWKVITYD